MQNQLVRVVDAAQIAMAIDYLVGYPALGSVAFPLVGFANVFVSPPTSALPQSVQLCDPGRVSEWGNDYAARGLRTAVSF